MTIDRAELHSIRLYPTEKEIAMRHAEANGMKLGAAVRNILRQWDAMTRAGIYVSQLPHPDDASPIPIIHIEKRD